MSSQRVVRFDLSAAQRAEVARCAQLHRRIRQSRMQRACRRVLEQRVVLLTENPHLEDLPSPAEVEREFARAAAGADPATIASEVEDGLRSAVSRARENRRAEVAAVSGWTQLSEARLAALLARLSASQPEPPRVTQLVTELRRARGTEVDAVWETLKHVVAAEREVQVRRARERDELDHAAAIVDGVALDATSPADVQCLEEARELAKSIALAADEQASGAPVESVSLLARAKSLQARQEKSHYEVHALGILQKIWSELGATVWPSDRGGGFVAAIAEHDRGMWVSVIEGVVYQRQVMLQAELPGAVGTQAAAPDSHALLCSAAENAEERAGGSGLVLGPVEVTDQVSGLDIVRLPHRAVAPVAPSRATALPPKYLRAD